MISFKLHCEGKLKNFSIADGPAPGRCLPGCGQCGGKCSQCRLPSSQNMRQLLSPILGNGARWGELYLHNLTKSQAPRQRILLHFAFNPLVPNLTQSLECFCYCSVYIGSANQYNTLYTLYINFSDERYYSCVLHIC